jgi:hypothetical protein
VTDPVTTNARIRITSTSYSTVSDTSNNSFTITAQSVVQGDVDSDGEITSGDAILTLRFAAEIQTPTVGQKAAADVDRDGEVTSGDAILILRYAAGLISAFSKPVALTPRPIDVSLSEVEHLPDGTLALSFLLNHVSDAVGGDLFLTYEPTIGQLLSFRIEGLSPEALSVINVNVPGQIRVSFADMKRSEDSEQFILRTVLSDAQEVKSFKIDLTGRLYNIWGVVVGEVRLDQTVASPLPTQYVLLQNYPNPFNSVTGIRYSLPAAGHVVLNVYHLTGQLVRTLVNDPIEAGQYTVEWDGRDDRGQEVSSGIYLYRLSANGGQFTAVRRMVLLK